MAVTEKRASARTLAQVRAMGRMGDLLDAIEESLAPFGAANVTEQVDAALEDFVDKAYEWADNTAEKFYETAPVLTGNLREAIAIDDSTMPQEIFVGIMWDKLKGPKTLPAIRDPYKGMLVAIPSYDYTIEANENNVTAYFGTGGPFIEEVWFAFAQAEARRLF